MAKRAEEKTAADAVTRAVRDTFRPEFLNRIDEIIIFHKLSHEQVLQIVDLMLVEVGERLTERNITLQPTDAAKDWLASEGFDPTFGARPLRRAIQRHVENVLSRMVLRGEIAEGETVVVDVGEDGLSFTVLQPANLPVTVQ